MNGRRTTTVFLTLHQHGTVFWHAYITAVLYDGLFFSSDLPRNYLIRLIVRRAGRGGSPQAIFRRRQTNPYHIYSCTRKPVSSWWFVIKDGTSFVSPNMGRVGYQPFSKRGGHRVGSCGSTLNITCTKLPFRYLLSIHNIHWVFMLGCIKLKTYFSHLINGKVCIDL